MSTQHMILNIPEPLYQNLKRRAEQASRSVEEETLAVLTAAVLPPDMDGEKKHPPNQVMLTALAEVERLQQGMQPTEDRNTLTHLREARSGEMYDHGHD